MNISIRLMNVCEHNVQEQEGHTYVISKSACLSIVSEVMIRNKFGSHSA